jgi:catechol 2,3-dioxygenase-like lactoylglutathione lyase family enzyme
MRLRQVALVAQELAPVVDDLTAVLGLKTPYRDSGVRKYGLENAVFTVGDQFLEVVAPVEEGTTAGRLLAKRGGDGGYMVILQVDDIAAARARVEALGVRVVDRFDGEGAWYTHLHPKDVGGAILSLDAMDPPGAWRWAGPDWEAARSETATAITAVEIQADDPAAMAARWAEVLGRDVAAGPQGPEVRLDEGVVRFVTIHDDRGEGVSGIDIAVNDIGAVSHRARRRKLRVERDIVYLCGTRVRLRPAGVSAAVIELSHSLFQPRM